MQMNGPEETLPYDSMRPSLLDTSLALSSSVGITMMSVERIPPIVRQPTSQTARDSVRTWQFRTSSGMRPGVRPGSVCTTVGVSVGVRSSTVVSAWSSMERMHQGNQPPPCSLGMSRMVSHAEHGHGMRAPSPPSIESKRCAQDWSSPAQLPLIQICLMR